MPVLNPLSVSVIFALHLQPTVSLSTPPSTQPSPTGSMESWNNWGSWERTRTCKGGSCQGKIDTQTLETCIDPSTLTCDPWSSWETLKGSFYRKRKQCCKSCQDETCKLRKFSNILDINSSMVLI